MGQDRKKILILVSSLRGGGAERVCAILADFLSRHHEVYVYPVYHKEIGYRISGNVKVLDFDSIPPDSTDRVARYLRGLRVLLSLRFLRKDSSWEYELFLERAMYRVWRFCRKKKIDVVLSFLSDPNMINAKTLHFRRKVMSERNNPLMKEDGYFRKMRRAFSRADTVIFQSETVNAMFPVRIRKKGVVLPNPVEVPCLAAGGSKRIVTLGRLNPQKNHKLLIRAFALFSTGHPSHTLHIYGRGDLLPELRDLVKELSLEDRVFLEGYRDDIHEAVKDAEQFVLSSDYEGMPNALLEAMMMGLPCVTTAFHGAEEFFGGTGACVMTPPGDEKALAEAMSRLADDDGFRSSLASRGKEYVRKYSLDNVLPLWEKVLFGE